MTLYGPSGSWHGAEVFINVIPVAPKENMVIPRSQSMRTPPQWSELADPEGEKKACWSQLSKEEGNSDLSQAGPAAPCLQPIPLPGALNVCIRVPGCVCGSVKRGITYHSQHLAFNPQYHRKPVWRCMPVNQHSGDGYRRIESCPAT